MASLPFRLPNWEVVATVSGAAIASCGTTVLCTDGILLDPVIQNSGGWILEIKALANVCFLKCAYISGLFTPFAATSRGRAVLLAAFPIVAATVCASWATTALIAYGIPASAAHSLAMLIEVVTWVLILRAGYLIATSAD